MSKRRTLFFLILTAATILGAWTVSAPADNSTAAGSADAKKPAANAAKKTDSDKPAANDSAAQLERLHKLTERRLGLMKDELGISDAQETAWGAYATTVMSLTGSKLTPPAPGGDAAAIVRFRAQQAAENAEKLTQLADATAKLEQVLNTEQRKALYQMVQPAAGPHAGSH